MATWSLRRTSTNVLPMNGIRPIQLPADLPALADLLEAAFTESMDVVGRRTIDRLRELGGMRFPLAGWLPAAGLLNGIRRSLVWVEDRQLLGNLSVYPAPMRNQRNKAWVLANIAVLPQQRGRGIATGLLREALVKLRERGATAIWLQVDEDNEVARHLYRKAGFLEETTICTWSRSREASPPRGLRDAPTIYRRPPSMARAEYDLVKNDRGDAPGRLGWLRTLEWADFRWFGWSVLADLLAGRWRERRVCRDEQGELTAVIWLERKLSGPIELSLFKREGVSVTELRALLYWALRRHPFQGVWIEHPAVDELVRQELISSNFYPLRTVVNMRLPEDV